MHRALHRLGAARSFRATGVVQAAQVRQSSTTCPLGAQVKSMNEKHSASWWNDHWTQDQTGWRAGENAGPPPFAKNLKYLADAVGVDAVAPGKRAFVPLCGESSIVPYLAEQGMDVVCVEASPLAVAKLRAKVAELSEEAQQRVTIVAGDFFAYDGAPFDLIYDRASFVAIDPELREKYLAVMTRVSKAGTVYFFEGIMRPEAHVAAGPPHHVHNSHLPELFAAPGWKVSADESTVADPNTVELTMPPWVTYRAAITRVA